MSPISKNKLLIVDDEPDMVESLKMMISQDREDFEIISASNGKEGIQKFKESNPVLIISDIKMPEMDGIEFCRHIFEKIINSKDSGIPFIFISGYDERDIDKEFPGKENYIRFLSKPFSSTKLLDTIDELTSIKLAAADFA